MELYQQISISMWLQSILIAPQELYALLKPKQKLATKIVLFTQSTIKNKQWQTYKQ